MTEEQIEKIAEEYDLEELLYNFDLTKADVLGILYESGMLDESILEELCPL